MALQPFLSSRASGEGDRFKGSLGEVELDVLHQKKFVLNVFRRAKLTPLAGWGADENLDHQQEVVHVFLRRQTSSR